MKQKIPSRKQKEAETFKKIIDRHEKKCPGYNLIPRAGSEFVKEHCTICGAEVVRHKLHDDGESMFDDGDEEEC